MGIFKTIIFLLITFFLILGFQNCSRDNVAFRSQDKVFDSIEEDLIAVEEEGESNIVENNEEENNNNNAADYKGAKDFICILKGLKEQGKSLKLAYYNSGLISQNAAIQTVCMSEYSCNNIVSKRFDVKGPHFRGYCKNGGAHSIQMSEEDLLELVE